MTTNYENPCEQYNETKYCSYPYCENYLNCIIAKYQQWLQQEIKD
jgi:hypothetical protein